MGILSTFRAGLTQPPQLPNVEARELTQLVTTLGREPVETIGADFESFTRRGYLDNGIIWACIASRLTLFAQGRLELENIRDEERKDLPPRLSSLVNNPWPNGSQSELLARIEQDTSLAGNYYIYQAEPRRFQRWRPDWVDIVLDPRGREVVGYLYHPGGRQSGKPPVPVLVEEVMHGSPYPDPLAAFRGASWLATVTREIQGDHAMNAHKQKFFENGATPNLLVTVAGTLNPDTRKAFETALHQKFSGVNNAYKTLVLEEGADATVIGADMRQQTFDVVQAAGENRIAVAAGVPSVVLGIKEGAAQATYSNYGQALQHFANFTVQHLWDHAASTFAQVLPVPAGQRLVFKTDHIPALQSDQKQDAEINEIMSTTIRELMDAGFEAQSVIDAVTSGDLTQLVHTGLVSDELAIAEETPALGTGDSEDEPAPLAFLNAGA